MQTHSPIFMKPFPILHLIVSITMSVFAGRQAVAQLNISFNPGETAVIIMKSGDKIEGKVLRDTPDSVEIEYKLTPKIKDRKILLKGDIASFKKQSPSETEFAESGLGKLLPTPDLKDASYYESTIQDKLRTFIAKHPGTPESAEVEKIAATFIEEKIKVVSGQLKMEGHWLDADTAKRDSYNIDACRQFMAMQEKAVASRESRYLEALRAFEKLRAGHGAAPYFLKAIPEALEYLKRFEVQVTEMIRDAPVHLQRRAEGLKQLGSNEASAARKAIEEEERVYKNTLDRQHKDNVKWRDISKFDVKGLQDITAVIEKERANLSALNVPALQAESNILMILIRYIADKNIAEADAALEKATKMKNPSFGPLIQSLTKELGILRESVKIEQKAAAAAASAAAHAPSVEDKAGTNPVAEAIKKVQEEKNQKAVDATTEAKATATKASATKVKPGSPQKSASPAATSESPSEAQSSLMERLNDYFPFIGGILLVIIALAWLIGKRKKEKD